MRSFDIYDAGCPTNFPVELKAVMCTELLNGYADCMPGNKVKISDVTSLGLKFRFRRHACLLCGTHSVGGAVALATTSLGSMFLLLGGHILSWGQKKMAGFDLKSRKCVWTLSYRNFHKEKPENTAPKLPRSLRCSSPLESRP